MPDNVDEEFFNRADAHILLSNEQLKDLDSHGKVSASMLFATTRVQCLGQCLRVFFS